MVQSSWDTFKKGKQIQTECERFELWTVFKRIKEVRKSGRPVDVLAVVDESLEQLNQPVYRACNNRPRTGFEDWNRRSA
ncbi:MAG: hypothetical protein R3C28_05110 [Pirellulaceae bacterium]